MENGTIFNEQITASSEFPALYHEAFYGRLHHKPPLPDTGGAWFARTNDKNQWLQVDLLSNQYTTVTGVASQGRHGIGYEQWVTRYKLQYSSDGLNFQYYLAQGQSKHKVKKLLRRVVKGIHQNLIYYYIFRHLSSTTSIKWRQTMIWQF